MGNVPYGMGKCSIDKMTADMAMELGREGVDVVSWWAGAPTQTEEVLRGSIDGLQPRRGIPPGLEAVPSFSALFYTGLASTLLYEGRSLAAFARDPHRGRQGGMALQSQQSGRSYGVRDERGISPPNFLSLKAQLILWNGPLFEFSRITNPETLAGPPTASPAQEFFFNTLSDFDIPQWLLKIIAGPPLTFPWPIP